MRSSRKKICKFPDCKRVIASNQFKKHFRSRHTKDGEIVVDATIMTYAEDLNDHKRKQAQVETADEGSRKIRNTSKPSQTTMQQENSRSQSSECDSENSSDDEAIGAVGDIDKDYRFEVVQSTEYSDGRTVSKCIARYQTQEDANKAVLYAFRHDTNQNGVTDLLKNEVKFLMFVTYGDCSTEKTEARRCFRWTSVTAGVASTV